MLNSLENVNTYLSSAGDEKKTARWEKKSNGRNIKIVIYNKKF